MKGHYKTPSAFLDRYKNPGFHLTRVKVNKNGMHTFAISQFGERLLPRRADGKYLYANVIAYLFKGPEEFSFNWDDYTFIGNKVTEQERDTYIEVLDAAPGYYWLYIDITW